MFPEAGWVVDLKADGTEAPLVRVLEEFDLTERVIVGSFSNERVESFRRLTGGRVATSTPPKETLRAVMAAAAPRFNQPAEGVFHPTTCALQVPATWYGVPIVSSALVSLAHAAGRLVHVWTVNGLDDAAALTDMGVDGLITDRPDLVAPWIRSLFPALSREPRIEPIISFDGFGAYQACCHTKDHVAQNHVCRRPLDRLCSYVGPGA